MRPGMSKNQLKTVQNETLGASGDLSEASCFQDREQSLPCTDLLMCSRHLVDFGCHLGAHWILKKVQK